MLRSLNWISALPSVLQTGIDSVVSAELHATAADICKFKPRRNADDSCGLLTQSDTSSADAAIAPSDNKIAA